MEIYLVIYPETFLWFNGTHGLFYNCEAHTLLHFSSTEIILKYCNRINDFYNMYVITVDEEDRVNPEFNHWLLEIETNKIGEIVKTNGNEKPYSVPPILNLQHIVEQKRMGDFKFRPYNIANNFHEITFELGGECLPDDERDFYKQIPYPASDENHIDLTSLLSFLNSTNVRYLQQINIITKTLSHYSDYNLLIEKLPLLGIHITFYIDGNDELGIMRLIESPFINNISVCLYYSNVVMLNNIEKMLKDKGIGHEWIFIIKEENDIVNTIHTIREYSIENYRLLPVITGTKLNQKLFEQSVYTTYKDLTICNLDKRNIFCNQTINSNFWGHIFVTPKKEVCGNFNGNIRGTMSDDLLSLLHDEMLDDDTFWKHTRRMVKPCSDCIFSCLCPPPSNYEIFTNKYDMCMIINERHFNLTQ